MINHSISKDSLLRLSQIIGNLKASPPIQPIIPVSKSTWWAGIRTGRFPKPVNSLGGRVTAWRASDVLKLVDQENTKEIDVGANHE